MKRHLIGSSVVGLSLGVVLSGCGSAANTHPHPKPAVVASGRNLRWSAPPPITINKSDVYQATVDTTKGSFVIHLFTQHDPVAVNNFVFLARHRFFNGDKIFRVIQPFMFQTGDPNNIGNGGPGYQWNGELPISFPYQPGIVAMANSGNPNTNGSQFFVCTGSQSEYLNQTPTYTEVGRVSSGMSTVQSIASGAVTKNPLTGEDSYPVHPVTILSVTIQQGSPSAS